MSEKLNEILEISQMADGEKEAVIWTGSFKVKGKLYTDQAKLKEGIVTFTDAVVCHHFDDCKCKDEAACYKWINIFEEHIIAFSILH